MRPHTTAMSLLHLTCWSCAFGPWQEEKQGFRQCFPPSFIQHLALHFVSLIFKPSYLSLLVIFKFLSRPAAVSSADSAQLQTESTTASWQMQLGTLTKDWPVATRSSSQDPYDQVPPWLWFERIWALQTRTSWKAKESALKVKARNKNKGCEAFCVSLKLASASEKSMRDLLLDCLQFNQCETRRRIFVSSCLARVVHTQKIGERKQGGCSLRWK